MVLTHKHFEIVKLQATFKPVFDGLKRSYLKQVSYISFPGKYKERERDAHIIGLCIAYPTFKVFSLG